MVRVQGRSWLCDGVVATSRLALGYLWSCLGKVQKHSSTYIVV